MGIGVTGFPLVLGVMKVRVGESEEEGEDHGIEI